MTLKVHICKRNSATHKNKIQHRHRFKEKTWINKVLWHNPVKLEPKTTSSSSLSLCASLFIYIFQAAERPVSCFLHEETSWTSRPERVAALLQLPTDASGQQRRRHRCCVHVTSELQKNCFSQVRLWIWIFSEVMWPNWCSVCDPVSIINKLTRSGL